MCILLKHRSQCYMKTFYFYTEEIIKIELNNSNKICFNIDHKLMDSNYFVKNKH